MGWKDLVTSDIPIVWVEEKDGKWRWHLAYKDDHNESTEEFDTEYLAQEDAIYTLDSKRMPYHISPNWETPSDWKINYENDG